MFDISSQKDTISIKRTLSLKKEGVLPAGTLDCVASIDLGESLSTPEGKGIVSQFASNFNGSISAKAKKQDERIKKVRQQLARWILKGESKTKIRTYADTQQEDIVRDWNQFMRVDIKRAALDALENALKKSDISFDDLKVRFSNVDLHDNKLEFLTGVLNIAGHGGQGRVAQAGMASLVSGMQNLDKPISTIRNSWDRNVKLLKQGVDDANAVSKNLVSLGKVTATLSARLERMKKISDSNNKVAAQSAKGVDMVLAAVTQHQKTAKLNDQDKIVIIANKAVSALSGAKKDSKAAQVNADSAKLELVLKEISKLLSEAEKLSKKSAGSFLSAAKATMAANNKLKAGDEAVKDALKELYLQSKMNK